MNRCGFYFSENVLASLSLRSILSVCDGQEIKSVWAGGRNKTTMSHKNNKIIPREEIHKHERNTL